MSENELSVLGLLDKEKCSECDRVKNTEWTDFGKSAVRKFTGLSLSVFGLSVVFDSPEIGVGAFLLSAPVSYLWARSQLEGDEL